MALDKNGVDKMVNEWNGIAPFTVEYMLVPEIEHGLTINIRILCQNAYL